MPLDKSGSYHANPAHARMADAHSNAAEPEQPAVSQAHEVHIHHPNHPETGDGQNFTVRVPHDDGTVEDSKHPDLESAHEHTKAAFGEPSEAEPDQEPDNDSDDSGDDSNADDEY